MVCEVYLSNRGLYSILYEDINILYVNIILVDYYCKYITVEKLL